MTDKYAVTADNVLEVLEKSPGSIAFAEALVEEARFQRDLAKVNLDTAKGKATLAYQTAKNSSILNAMVDSDENVIACKQTLIDSEKRLHAAQREYHLEENRFVSARKIAGMDSEIKANRGQTFQRNS